MAKVRQRVRNAVATDRDGGAVAVLVAVLAVALFGAAALAIDVAALSYERQNLQNTLDTAAQAGAYELPTDPVAARSQALAFAAKADPKVTPTNGLVVDFWCIVASTGALKQVNTAQIPSTCNPGAGPYNTSRYPGLVCNTTRCAIPCNTSTTGVTCNTIRVVADKNVPFSFAPAIGIGSGQTGATASIACKGPCGEESPNPMDVVVVADRSPSMSDQNRVLMADAIRSMVGTMEPTSQYVALATIGKSKSTTACSTASATSYSQSGASWMATSFSNTYKSSPGTDRVITGLSTTCFEQGYGGTDLASSMKSAARYLLGLDTNNLSSLPARVGTPRKVLIFETDGRPQVNNGTSTNGSTALTSAPDIRYTDNTQADILRSCQAFTDVANNAKNADPNILVITIAFGSASTNDCTGTPGPATFLAAAATDDPKGGPSVASACSTQAQRDVENRDGDFFFCAAGGAEMESIFKTALAQASKSIRLVPLPG